MITGQGLAPAGRTRFARSTMPSRVGTAISRSTITARLATGARASQHAIGGRDQFARDRRLEGGVAGVRRDAQVSFRPGAMQVPGAAHWAHDIVATLNYHRRDMANRFDVAQQLAVAVHESAIDEVVRFDSGECSGVVWVV